jgi:hypothetical protein
VLGLHLYVSDFGVYPANDPSYWFESLKPYVRAAWPPMTTPRGVPPIGTFACPGYNSMPGAYTPGPTLNGGAAVFGAYAYNASGIDLDPTGGGVSRPGGGYVALGLGGI